MLTTIINLALYSTALAMVMIIGYLRPSWRGEVAGAAIAIGARALYYITSIVDRAGVYIMPDGIIHTLSIFSSMFTGVIMVTYGAWIVYGIREENGLR